MQKLTIERIIPGWYSEKIITDIARRFQEQRRVDKGFSPERVAQHAVEMMQAKQGAGWFVRIHEYPVAVLCVQRVRLNSHACGDVGYENALFVTEECENRGKAFLMLHKEAIKWCKREGLEKMIMSTLASGDINVERMGKFYQSLGYDELQRQFIKNV